MGLTMNNREYWIEYYNPLNNHRHFTKYYPSLADATKKVIELEEQGYKNVVIHTFDF